MKTSQIAKLLLSAILSLTCICSHAEVHADGAAIDEAAIAEVADKYKIPSRVVSHIELTQAFETRSPWTLVVTQQPESTVKLPDYIADGEGAVSICFVKGMKPDCSDETFLKRYAQQSVRLVPGERPFYTLFSSAIVHAESAGRAPLLAVQACTVHYGNNSCWVSTILYAYDRESDSFRTVFYGLTGSNNNQTTRFIESGPLLGRVIVATPTDDAPYGYFVEVYKRSVSGDYRRVLRYRSRTHYGDGNSLSVVDSEMPEILRRSGLWRAGQNPPEPARRPKGCSQLVLHQGVEWCEAELAATGIAIKQ